MSEKPAIAAKVPCVKEMDPGKYWWCSCGKSAKQPFCDGSHKGSSFQPIKVELTEAKKVAWCQCKCTKNSPYCDGSHKTL